MAVLGAALLTVGFILLMRPLGLVKRSAEVMKTAKSALEAMTDAQADDCQKERALQQHAKTLFGHFVWITAGSTVAAGIPLGCVWLLDAIEVMSLQDVITTSLSWPFLTTILVFSLIYFYLRHYMTARPDEVPYSALERNLHTLAFGTWGTQSSLSHVEDRLFKTCLDAVTLRPPVFIAGLPRSGTTLLLDLCVKTNDFVSHTYRDMPFLATPLLWQRFSRRFRQETVERERAHGDGMMVSVDTPEAFEEVLWKGFWPSRYRKNYIVPWETHSYPEFERFFASHLKKMVILKRGSKSAVPRYISKNNLNICRIRYLRQVWPEAVVVVPYRDPLQHASSLLRQHKNFSAIHRRDPFACRYMRDIGHFDFGENLRPVDFNQWFSSGTPLDPNELRYWLRYWIETYQYLLDTVGDQVTFFSFDRFCVRPRQTMEALCCRLTLPTDEEGWGAQMEHVRPPKPYAVAGEHIDANLRDQAESLTRQLDESSLQSLD